MELRSLKVAFHHPSGLTELYPLVAKLFKTYGPLKDAQSGLPLFNADAWKIAQSILKMIKNGFISDCDERGLCDCEVTEG